MGNTMKKITQCLPTKMVDEHTEEVNRLVNINMGFLESLDDDDCVVLEYSKNSVV